MKRRDEVLVGVLLVAATIVGVLGTLWLVRGGLSSGYPLYTVVSWGAGLTQGQPVLLAGARSATSPTSSCARTGRWS